MNLLEGSQTMIKISVFLSCAAVAGCEISSSDDAGSGSGSQGGSSSSSGGTDAAGSTSSQGGADGGDSRDCTHGYNYVVTPECLAAACEDNDCGDASSLYDADMCFRPSCGEGESCAPGSTCREVTYSPVTCSGVTADTPECECGWQSVSATGSFCFPDP